MDKVKEIEASFNHGISLAERKNIVVTGVKKIDNFDNNSLKPLESLSNEIELCISSPVVESIQDIT